MANMLKVYNYIGRRHVALESEYGNNFSMEGFVHMETAVDQLKKGLTAAFIDKGVYSGESYRPQLILNNHKLGQ